MIGFFTTCKRIEQLQESLQRTPQLFVLERPDEGTSDFNVFTPNSLLAGSVNLFGTGWNGGIKTESGYRIIFIARRCRWILGRRNV